MPALHVGVDAGVGIAAGAGRPGAMATASTVAVAVSVRVGLHPQRAGGQMVVPRRHRRGCRPSRLPASCKWPAGRRRPIARHARGGKNTLIASRPPAPPCASAVAVAAPSGADRGGAATTTVAFAPMNASRLPLMAAVELLPAPASTPTAADRRGQRDGAHGIAVGGIAHFDGQRARPAVRRVPSPMYARLVPETGPGGDPRRRPPAPPAPPPTGRPSQVCSTPAMIVTSPVTVTGFGLAGAGSPTGVPTKADDRAARGGRCVGAGARSEPDGRG